MSLESTIFRSKCKKSDAVRDAGMTIPDDIIYIRDNKYGYDEKYNSLDICYPKDKEDKKLPLIISVHGGGYVYGTKEVYQFYCADLARRGFTVVNFNYRLAPKYKFPAPVEDLSKVIEWLEEKDGRYPMDLSNVFLIGDSCGAQIASQYAAIYANEEYRKLFRLRKPEIKIRALSFSCGRFDLEKYLEEKWTPMVKDYFTSYPPDLGERIKVMDYVDENFPPSYIFSAEGDFMLDNVEPMMEHLESKGVECESKVYGDENTHHVFNIDVKSSLANRANDDQCKFLKKYIV